MKTVLKSIFPLIISFSCFSQSSGKENLNLVFYSECSNKIITPEFDIDIVPQSENVKILTYYIERGEWISQNTITIDLRKNDTIRIPKILFGGGNELHSQHWTYLNCDEICEGKETDSLKLFFNLQWRPIYTYTPLKSTYEEMTNSSHLNIIQSDEVRSAIVKMYNSYEDLEKDEDFLLDYFKNLVNELSKKVTSIYNPSIEDILALSKDKYIMNSIRLNGAYSRLNNYNESKRN